MTMMMDVHAVTWEAIDADHLAELISEKTHLAPELGVYLAQRTLSAGDVRFFTTEAVTLAEVDGERLPVLLPSAASQRRVMWSTDTGLIGRHAYYRLTREVTGTEQEQS